MKLGERRALPEGVTIRRGTPEDTPALLEMARQFIDQTRYGRLFRATGESLEKLAGLVWSLGQDAAVLVADDRLDGLIGMIVVVKAKAPYADQFYADEVVWWVTPNARSRRLGPALMHAAEDWAREHGCYMVKMVAPIPSTVGRFYECLGYEPVETAYAKVL